jgi:imidazolonepropionase
MARWDTLWLGTGLATMASGPEPYGLIEEGALAAKNGRIAWVGQIAALPEAPGDLAEQVIDASGLWLLPGLIDCHTHLVHGGSRAHEFELRLQGASYEEIARAGGGILSTVTATRAASEDELVEGALPRLDGLLVEGVTTVEIKSGYGLDLDTERRMLRAARQLAKLRPVTLHTSYLGAHAVPPEFGGRADDYVTFVGDMVLPTIAAEGLADSVDGFCERIAFTAAQIERVFRASARVGLPVRLHAEQLSLSGGAALAARHGALSADHLEYLDGPGVHAMAEAGTVAVLLPGAFYFLGETQLPPVDLLRDRGVPIAVATDCNPGSSPLFSLLLAVNMACVLFGLTPEEALAGVTRNAARALGLEAERGTLEVGKAADLALFAVEHPRDLAYRIGVAPCFAVVKNGRLVGGALPELNA